MLQVHTAVLLGTATLFSGTAWQPVVNAAHQLSLEFTPAAALTMPLCGWGDGRTGGWRGGRLPPPVQGTPCGHECACTPVTYTRA